MKEFLRWESAVDHLDWNQIAKDSLLIVSVLGVTSAKSFDKIVSSVHEIVVVHAVTALVVLNLYVPSFWQHLNFLLVDSVDELEVSFAEFEVVQGELDSDHL